MSKNEGGHDELAYEIILDEINDAGRNKCFVSPGSFAFITNNKKIDLMLNFLKRLELNSADASEVLSRLKLFRDKSFFGDEQKIVVAHLIDELSDILLKD